MPRRRSDCNSTSCQDWRTHGRSQGPWKHCAARSLRGSIHISHRRGSSQVEPFRIGVFMRVKRIGPIAAMMLATLAVQPLHSWAAGDVVEYIEAKNLTNPPPSVSLETFDRFEIAPIAMVAP